MMPLSPEYYFCTSRLSRLVQHWQSARLPDPRAAYTLSPSQSFASLTLMLPQIGSSNQGWLFAGWSPALIQNEASHATVT